MYKYLKVLFLLGLFLLAYVQAYGQKAVLLDSRVKTTARKMSARRQIAINNAPPAGTSLTLARQSMRINPRRSKSFRVRTNLVQNLPQKIVPNQTFDLSQLLAATAAEQQIPLRLWYSLIYQESRFKLGAASPKGAKCYAQLMPGTARRFGLRVDLAAGIDDRRHPLACLRAGAQYFRFLLDTFNNHIPLALAGYNAGEGAVMKYGWKIPPYSETRDYVEKILTYTYGRAGLSYPYQYKAKNGSLGGWQANLVMLPVPSSGSSNQRLGGLNPNPFSASAAAPVGENNNSASSSQAAVKLTPRITYVSPERVMQPRLPTSSVYFTSRPK